MSEHDATTGQFTSAEPAFGREAEERAAGYVPMPDEIRKREGEAFETPREAADALSRPGQSEITPLILTDGEGNPAPENETLTLEQASQLLSDSHRKQGESVHGEAGDAIRAAVDELRGVKPEGEATTDEPADADKPADGKKAAEPTKDDGELPADFEKSLPPKVREAVAAQIAETETARQSAVKAVEIANDFARVSFMENFPEISGLPLEQWEGALAAMAQREPDRFNRAINSLQRVVSLQAEQQQQQAQRAAADRQKFDAYARSENARFETLVKDETPETMRAVEKQVPKLLKAYGADARQFLEAISNQSTFPRAAAERLLVDAAKYHMIMDAKAKAAPASLPPVQRPGTAAPRALSGTATISALEARFAQSGSIKDAAALRSARQKARG